MSYPDDLEWNQLGVEPTQAKKDEGWLPEEKPPAEYFNWFFNRTSQAVKYLKGESDKSIDDAKIGNRIITDTTTAVTGANTLTKLLSMLGNMIKQITGKSNWYTPPATTLEAANTHITTNGNPHGTTAEQVGAAASNDPRLSDARPADGGNADTVGGKYASDFLNKNSNNHYFVNDSEYLDLVGDGSAILHHSTDSTLKWLTGLRSDISGNANDYVIFGYGGKVLVNNADLYIRGNIAMAIVASGSGANYYWRKWSNGDIEQWCEGVDTTTGDQAQTVSFPLQFPTACKHVQVSTHSNSDALFDANFQERNRSISSVVVTSQFQGGGSMSGGGRPLIYAIGN